MKYRIRESWDSYRKRVIPRDAPPVQISESRRAFYAGAAGLWGTLVKMLEPGEKETAADLQKMNELDQELQEFTRDVKAGRA